MKRLIRILMVSMAISLISSPYLAQAEFYAAGMVGATFPEKLTDVKGTGVASGFSFSDLSLHDSVMYGGKAGYYFDKLKWLGIEAEAFTTTPHIKQQPITACVANLCAPAATLTGADFRVTTLAFNLVGRYPGERLQPYVGAGLGVFFARSTIAGTTQTDNAVPGANALAGLRFLLTKHLAIFAEYKFQYAHFSFDPIAPGVGLTADYMAHNAVGGVAWHF